WATLIAVEDGSTSLDAQVGQQDCTLAHLLSHAGGYSFDGAVPIVTPGRKRIYSNTGYELVADHIEQVTEINFSDFLREAILATRNVQEFFERFSGT
ncbi:MAG: serine hydrolase, partial [Acidimicrobiaceae bacterium]